MATYANLSAKRWSAFPSPEFRVDKAEEGKGERETDDNDLNDYEGELRKKTRYKERNAYLCYTTQIDAFLWYETRFHE